MFEGGVYLRTYNIIHKASCLIIVHIICACTHCLYMYTLSVHVHIICKCTHYLYMYTLSVQVLFEDQSFCAVAVALP